MYSLFSSFQIRNPLAAAMVAHSFITSRFEVNETPDDTLRKEVEDDHKIIDSSLRFIDDFLRSMLLMYRASANKLDVDMVQTNLYKQVFEPVANILRPQKGAFDLSIDCPRNLEVMTDNLRLKQILLNLGRNSSKFVKTGFIRLCAYVVNGRVELAVEDSGPGVPREMRKVLFQKYHTSLAVVSQGNGIGLTLCKNLANLLGGNIWLDETYDSGIPGSPGARFVVRIGAPIEVCPTAEPAGQSYKTPDVQANQISAPDFLSISNQNSDHFPRTLSVLLVDDDAVLRKLFARSIQRVRPDWTIQGAENGEKALDYVLEQTGKTKGYDLIFVDQYMASTEPRMTGTETVAELRRRGVQSVIVGLSANDMEHDFLSVGANHFLLKPLPCDRLTLTTELERITSGISRRHTSDPEDSLQ